MLDALAFLPVAEVVEGMDYLRNHVPSCNETSELTALVGYFDKTYVSGSMRAIQHPNNDDLRLRLQRTAPLFPPSLWKVHKETLNDGDRTNNMSETWNKAFAVLVGHSHLSVLTAVEAFQTDLAVIEQVVEQDARRQPPVKCSTEMYSIGQT